MLVVKDGVVFMKLWGFTHLAVETNCVEVVHLWNTHRDPHLVVAHILLEIGELVLAFFFLLM